MSSYGNQSWTARPRATIDSTSVMWKYASQPMGSLCKKSGTERSARYGSAQPSTTRPSGPSSTLPDDLNPTTSATSAPASQIGANNHSRNCAATNSNANEIA